MISEMSILTGSSLSQESCSPRSIWISEAAVPSTQWAAVRIHSLLMTVAPQKTEELPDQIQIRCPLVALGASQSLQSPCRWAYGRKHILNGRIRLLASLILQASLIPLAFQPM